MPDPVFAVTTQDILTQLSRRIDLSTLSPEEIQLAIEEVQEAIQHHLDIREYIEIGLDSWEITRTL